MTQVTYGQTHGLPYKGKHVKRWYRVWRVFGPGGPQQEIQVLGFDEAKQMCFGCWDWEVTDAETGKVVY